MRPGHWMRLGLSVSIVMTILAPALSRAQQPTPPPQPTAVEQLRQLRILARQQQPQGNASWAEAIQPGLDQGSDLWTQPGRNQEFAFVVQEPTDAGLGATIQPVGDTLRAQLGIPEGEGLVVSSLAENGPAAQAGLHTGDILMALAKKSLNKTEDLTQELKQVGDSPVPLKILRGGKPLEILVRPIHHVTLGPAEPKTTEYYIGVAANPPDEVLRTQLDLPADQGLVVSEVQNGSPAEKAGVKPHDILLAAGDKPLDSTQTLVAQVQAAKEQPIPLKLLHAGKTQTVQVTPAARPVADEASRNVARLFYVDNRVRSRPAMTGLYDGRITLTKPLQMTPMPLDAATHQMELKQRFDTLEKELTALHEAVDRLSKTLEGRESKNEK